MENTKNKAVIFRIMQNDTGGKYVLSILFAVVLYSILSHTFLPADSAFAVSTYTITLLGKYISFALLAVVERALEYAQTMRRCLP